MTRIQSKRVAIRAMRTVFRRRKKALNFPASVEALVTPADLDVLEAVAKRHLPVQPRGD